MRNRLIYGLGILLFLSLSLNLFRSWLSLQKRGDIIKKTQEQLRGTKEQQEELKRKLAMTQSEDYIIKQAREKLNLGKEGEIVVLIPSISPLAEPTPTPLETLSNWEKWIKVFF